jgi:hypothetical protein
VPRYRNPGTVFSYGLMAAEMSVVESQALSRGPSGANEPRSQGACAATAHLRLPPHGPDLAADSSTRLSTSGGTASLTHRIADLRAPNSDLGRADIEHTSPAGASAGLCSRTQAHSSEYPPRYSPSKKTTGTDRPCPAEARR